MKANRYQKDTLKKIYKKYRQLTWISEIWGIPYNQVAYAYAHPQKQLSVEQSMLLDKGFEEVLAEEIRPDILTSNTMVAARKDWD